MTPLRTPRKRSSMSLHNGGQSCIMETKRTIETHVCFKHSGCARRGLGGVFTSPFADSVVVFPAASRQFTATQFEMNSIRQTIFRYNCFSSTESVDHVLFPLQTDLLDLWVGGQMLSASKPENQKRCMPERKNMVPTTTTRYQLLFLELKVCVFFFLTILMKFRRLCMGYGWQQVHGLSECLQFRKSRTLSSKNSANTYWTVKDINFDFSGIFQQCSWRVWRIHNKTFWIW